MKKNCSFAQEENTLQFFGGISQFLVMVVGAIFFCETLSFSVHVLCQEQLASSQCVESGPANQQPLEQDHQHGGVLPSHVLRHAQQRPDRQGHHSQVGLLGTREKRIVGPLRA